MKRTIALGFLLTTPLFATSIATPAQATIIQVTSRADLNANVAIDWGIFGPAGTTIVTPETPVSAGPLSVEVSSSDGALARHDEGPGYLGNFAPGAHLLTDAGTLSDSFIVNFSTPVNAVGTQIQADPAGPFTGYMFLYSGSTLLDTLTVGGDHTTAEDNSAVFIGAISDSFDITRVDFAVDYPSLPGVVPPIAGGLAINELDVDVPEPASLALLLAGLAGLVGLRRQRSGRMAAAA